jgi:DNA repair protein RecO (recombination protein O)
MALHKDQAIILSTRVFGESDKIVRFFTLNSGKLTGIAKGGKKSRKRFTNTLELFNHVDLEYFEKPGKGMVRIDNADLRRPNSGIESSFKKMCTASFFAEFVDRLTREKERNEGLFNLLGEGLENIKLVEFTYSDVLYYQLRVLRHLGYMPNFETCVHCGKDLAGRERTSFSNERGGVVCALCALSVPHRTYSEDLLSRLAHGSDDDRAAWPKPAGGDDRAEFERRASELMEAFVSFHLNVEFKSYRLLRSVTG